MHALHDLLGFFLSSFPSPWPFPAGRETPMAPTIALGCISMSSHVGASLLWLLLIYWFSEQFHLPLGTPGTLDNLLDTLFFFGGGEVFQGLVLRLDTLETILQHFK